MFPWMLDLAAPLPLPRAPGQLRAPDPKTGVRRAAGASFPLTSAALPNDNAAPGVMTPRAALLLWERIALWRAMVWARRAAWARRAMGADRP